MILTQTAMLIVFLLVYPTITLCRIHQLVAENDTRRYIPLSKFGFYQDGELKVRLQNFRAHVHNQTAVFGFSLDRTTESRQNLYVGTDPKFCTVHSPNLSEYGAIVYFIMDLERNEMRVFCSPDWYDTHFYKGTLESNGFIGDGSKNNVIPCSALSFPLSVEVDSKGIHSYNMSFDVKVMNDDEEGFYSLYFHNCLQQDVSFQIQITEQNADSFLSADEIPLPMLYSTLALLFLMSGIFWLFLLRRSKHPVFKLHYLMAAVVFLKASTLIFHGVNYHFIESLGVPLRTWTVFYYIAFLVSDTLFFVMVVLIGTGWTFIKHVLALRDQLLFMAIIPLQILGNVIAIILEESVHKHETWNTIYRVVDFLSCACILIPAFFSLCYLRQAKGAYGEPKLFRNFYIMLVVYIYFTRIVPYILRITLSFQYGWLEQTMREIATFGFLVWTGCKFSPAVHYQYYSLLQDKEEENNQVITKSGITEGVIRTKK